LCGIGWQELGENEKAIEYLKEALTIYQQMVKNEHPEVANNLYFLGVVCWRQGDLEQAVNYFREALRIGQKIYPKSHPDLAKYSKEFDRVQQALKKRQADLQIEVPAKTSYFCSLQ